MVLDFRMVRWGTVPDSIDSLSTRTSGLETEDAHHNDADIAEHETKTELLSPTL